ncbi:hypothetical protein TWF730_003546 [Orbilia blumenaviensis]|uniref:HNH nuclease domain-containing protein n=1 Tax=Orbilia blumenaviensis TaxID=1796055 RepID=A0AAV9U4P9_9PEZI
MSFQTPFLQARERHPIYYTKSLQYLDELSILNHPEKHVLAALLDYTTNPNLLTGFRFLTGEQLKELAVVAVVGLLELRGKDIRSNRDNQGGGIGELRELEGLSGNEEEDVMDISLGSSLLDTLGAAEPPQSPPEPPIIGPPYLPEHMATSCKRREGHRCALTGFGGFIETARLFPHETFNLPPSKPEALLTWRFLSILLGEALKTQLLRELTSPETGIHTSSNGINFNLDYAQTFHCGKFGFIPCKESKNPDYLDVELRHYVNIDKMNSVDGAWPQDPNQQYEFNEDGVGCRILLPAESHHQIKNGDIIRLASAEAGLPLPSIFLLFWHQYLWRILGVAGLWRVGGEDFHNMNCGGGQRINIFEMWSNCRSLDTYTAVPPRDKKWWKRYLASEVEFAKGMTRWYQFVADIGGDSDSSSGKESEG